MTPAAIIFLVLGGVWLLVCLAGIACVVLLDRRDARRPPIAEHQEEWFR